MDEETELSRALIFRLLGWGVGGDGTSGLSVHQALILTALLPRDKAELGARGMNARRIWPTPVP